ncbi:hypothetical protein SDC9_136768 [bioreactor metagenome]|uniref:Uncharacterized protein n=1 Tax=bioreactor metagenome TaxID=1076179 RepID=A0A645DK24_9ZZZZ|nr:hypothetical protein [Paludibacter sp.]
MQKKWKKHVSYLEQNINSKSLDQMAEELKVDRESLRLFLHHHKKFKLANHNNIIIRLLTSLIGHPEYFTPTRNFFEETRIGQRRWWQLFKGEKTPTEKEYMAICRHLNVDDMTHLEARQLNIFDNNEFINN